MYWPPRRQTLGTSHSCHSGFRQGECAAAAGKRDLQQRALLQMWGSEFDPPSSVSEQLKTQVNICVLHLRPLLTFHHSVSNVSLYLTLNNVKLSYLRNNCLPALRLTHQLPPWPDVHPKCLWSPSTTEDSELTLGKCKHADACRSPASVRNPAQCFWALQGWMWLVQITWYNFIVFSVGPTNGPMWPTCRQRNTTQNLSQIRIWFHIITIWQKQNYS